MPFWTFMKENWLKSLIVFVILVIFSISLLLVHNIVEGNGASLLLELLSIILFFISLVLLGPYLAGVIATESQLIFLGITWNVFVSWSVIVINVIYVYLLSCFLVFLWKRIMGD